MTRASTMRPPVQERCNPDPDCGGCVIVEALAHRLTDAEMMRAFPAHRSLDTMARSLWHEATNGHGGASTWRMVKILTVRGCPHLRGREPVETGAEVLALLARDTPVILDLPEYETFAWPFMRRRFLTPRDPGRARQTRHYALAVDTGRKSVVARDWWDGDGLLNVPVAALDRLLRAGYAKGWHLVYD